jgi:hypothetical protein
MAGVLREIFKQQPLAVFIPATTYGWGGMVFVTGDLEVARRTIGANPRLAAQIAKWQSTYPLHLPGTTPITTYDWPYVYLESPRIPALYMLFAVLLTALLYLCLRRLKRPGLLRDWRREEWHFFFLGAAFLLLEVQNISKAAVALGNTWLVNAVIITGVLLMILVANSIASRFPQMRLAPIYAALIGSCLILYFVDLAWFAGLTYWARAIVVGGLSSLPMLFSGIIFVRSFAVAPRKDIALGANLLGGLVGGLLQAITFLTGIKMLLLIVASLYFAGLLTRPLVGNTIRRHAATMA